MRSAVPRLVPAGNASRGEAFHQADRFLWFECCGVAHVHHNERSVAEGNLFGGEVGSRYAWLAEPIEHQCPSAPLAVLAMAEGVEDRYAAGSLLGEPPVGVGDVDRSRMIPGDWAAVDRRGGA